MPTIHSAVPKYPGSHSHNRQTPDFDPLAKIYRWMEYCSFGPILERCRFHFLPQCSGARKALILGDGDGRFTARLLASNHKVQVDAVDASAAMLTELRQRVQQAAPNAIKRLKTFHIDIRDFVPTGNDYDLVVSHFLLDCLTDTEVECLIERILPHLDPNAEWIISEFSISHRGWRRIYTGLVIHFLYFAFNKMTHLRVRHIPNYAQILCRFGFHRREQNHFLGGLLVAEVWKREK